MNCISRTVVRPARVQVLRLQSEVDLLETRAIAVLFADAVEAIQDLLVLRAQNLIVVMFTDQAVAARPQFAGAEWTGIEISAHGTSPDIHDQALHPPDGNNLPWSGCCHAARGPSQA